MRSVRLALVVAVATVCLAVGAPSASAAAPAYSISGSYVAGISSGGYLATQLHVAYSSKIRGAAVFAGGPYYCAQGQLTQALMACMNDLLDNQLARLQSTAANWSAQGRIDPISNLGDDPVYLYHGTNDTTVRASVSADSAAFYRHFGASVVANNAEPAGHAWVSPRGVNPCNSSHTPYINRCNSDPQGALLRHLLGPVNPPNTGPLTGAVHTIDQNAYAPGRNAAAISMDRTGYSYLPQSCSSGVSCRLVIALHGCQQGHARIGRQFIDNAYLNQYADTNRLVILYPQAVATSNGNPNGCWDWWGYTGANYAQRGAPQMETILAMARALGA